MEATAATPLLSEEEGRKKLSMIIKEVFDPHNETETIGELIDGLAHHGMAIVLILFSIPSALPVPAAGYSTILSIPLFFIGFRLLLGRETVWLPERWRQKEFSPKRFAKFSEKMNSFVLFLERFSKPRFTSFIKSAIARTFMSLIILCLACSMALPIPGTNTLPAGGIFLIGFAMLEDDGLFFLAGVLYSIAALCLSVAVIFFGYEVVKLAIKSVF